MMKPYIAVLQFGPVQDFIHTARRTDDYWAGSFLLSYATAKAITLLEKMNAEIIFPNPENNALVAAVSDNQFRTEESLYPSLPNRVGARLEAADRESIKNQLNRIRQCVLNELVSMFAEVERKLTSRQVLSREQVNDMFEVFWAFAEDNPSDQGAAIQQVETRLAARKNIRDFTKYDREGHKCTQCGIRQPLRGEAHPEDITALKQYWQETIPKNKKIQYRFKTSERLCSVCAGKRLLRQVHFGASPVPSTSTIAVSAWLNSLAYNLDLNEIKYANPINDFVCALKEAQLGHKMSPVPGNRAKHHPLYAIEGDCFIEDSYDRFEKESKEGQNDSRPEAIRTALEKLKKFLKAVKQMGRPPKYFTILAFDGDNMGEYRRVIQTRQGHLQFSGELADFTKSVYKTIHDCYHGYVIYSGGDEGVALLPLSETLSVMNDLRKKFNGLNGHPTLSAGAAIVHHQAPLGDGLKAAQDILKNQAKKIEGKNGFAIKICKRSGAHMLCRAPWVVEENLEITAFLEKWRDAYKQNFSQRWWQRLYLNLQKDSDWNRDLFINALYHTLPRHAPPQKSKLGIDLARATGDMLFAHKELSDIKNLMTLLYVPIYMDKGGQA